MGKHLGQIQVLAEFFKNSVSENLNFLDKNFRKILGPAFGWVREYPIAIALFAWVGVVRTGGLNG